jgi:hypothetical protein
MLPLTRRRDPEAREERWHIYYDDVHVGTIAKSAGVRSDVEQWGWICGFHPGERLTGTARDFEQARAEFEAAWRILSAKRTEADYDAWRDERDWTVWKYTMWETGLKMPTQTQDGTARCFCGAMITIASVESHVRAAHKMKPRIEALT